MSWIVAVAHHGRKIVEVDAGRAIALDELDCHLGQLVAPDLRGRAHRNILFARFKFGPEHAFAVLPKHRALLFRSPELVFVRRRVPHPAHNVGHNARSAATQFIDHPLVVDGTGLRWKIIRADVVDGPPIEVAIVMRDRNGKIEHVAFDEFAALAQVIAEVADGPVVEIQEPFGIVVSLVHWALRAPRRGDGPGTVNARGVKPVARERPE